VFVKKEEMIRHFKWHKKRDESLQHGFMRYSTMDDCSDRFTNCQHNRKQTHYHCIKKRADGVSTLNDQLFIRPDTLSFNTGIFNKRVQNFPFLKTKSAISAITKYPVLLVII
jgi:hypothetical protein